MKKKTNKTEKKKIYCLTIDGDGGQLWLGHDKEPLCHISCNDANFREEYQGFIFDYLNINLICEYICPKNEDLLDKLLDNCGSPKKLAKLLKEEIDKLP